MYKHTLARVAGVIIILFGLHLTGIFKIKALYTDARLHSLKGSNTPFGAFVIGFAFAFGWTPCLGPILTAILTIAGEQDTLVKGILLLAVYSMGLAVPFLLTSLLMERFLKFYSRFRSKMHALEIASGGIADRARNIAGDRPLHFDFELAFVLEPVRVVGFRQKCAFVRLEGVCSWKIYRRLATAPRTPPRRTEGVPSGSAPLNPPRRSPLALIVVVVLVALMLYFAAHKARPHCASEAHSAQPSIAPDFSLESLDGGTMRLSDLRGKAVLLNFWATWCGPCKIEMPWFVDLQNQYRAQGLQIVGVAMDDASKADIAKFAKDMGVNYPILIGKEAVGDEYGGVPALPETFLIGRDGKIVDKIIGLRGKSEIEDSIKKALDTKAASARRQ